MQQINTLPQIKTEIKIVITLEELNNKLQTGGKRQNIVDAAKKTLETVNNSWNPSLVYRWLPIKRSETTAGDFVLGDSTCTSLTLGHSSRFLVEAEHTLIAAYTAGDILEKTGQESSKNQQFLEAYILDILGLLVLEKTGKLVTQKAEQQAAEFGWGVSPFLSPGSVHGWELEEQLKIAPLLPLEKIGVSIRSDGVLDPFKSLTCLIGIGSAYTNKQVGSTCQVCSKNSNCQMRQQS